MDHVTGVEIVEAVCDIAQLTERKGVSVSSGAWGGTLYKSKSVGIWVTPSVFRQVATGHPF